MSKLIYCSLCGKKHFWNELVMTWSPLVGSIRICKECVKDVDMEEFEIILKSKLFQSILIGEIYENINSEIT